MSPCPKTSNRPATREGSDQIHVEKETQRIRPVTAATTTEASLLPAPPEWCVWKKHSMRFQFMRLCGSPTWGTSELLPEMLVSFLFGVVCTSFLFLPNGGPVWEGIQNKFADEEAKGHLSIFWGCDPIMQKGTKLSVVNSSLSTLQVWTNKSNHEEPNLAKGY